MHAFECCFGPVAVFRTGVFHGDNWHGHFCVRRRVVASETIVLNERAARDIGFVEIFQHLWVRS